MINVIFNREVCADFGGLSVKNHPSSAKETAQR
jgi:hypothetical protein